MGLCLFTPVLVLQNNLVASVVTLLRLMDEPQYRTLLKEYREKPQLRVNIE